MKKILIIIGFLISLVVIGGLCLVLLEQNKKVEKLNTEIKKINNNQNIICEKQLDSNTQNHKNFIQQLIMYDKNGKIVDIENNSKLVFADKEVYNKQKKYEKHVYDDDNLTIYIPQENNIDFKQNDIWFYLIKKQLESVGYNCVNK